MGMCRAIAISIALAFCCAFAAESAMAAVPAGERAVLDALYKQTQGPGWTKNTGWTGAAGTECTWYGVICDSDGTHVVALYLSGDNLRGPLPALGGPSRINLMTLRPPAW